MQCVPMTVRMLREAGVMLIVVCGARGAVPAWWTVWTQDLGWRGKAAAALGNSASAGHMGSLSSTRIIRTRTYQQQYFAIKHTQMINTMLFASLTVPSQEQLPRFPFVLC